MGDVEEVVSMLKVTGSAHVQSSTLHSVLSLLLLFYMLLVCPLPMCPLMYVPLLQLSDADEIIVIIKETPSVVNPPVEERSLTSRNISEPTSINVYNGTIVHVKYSTANKAGCHALRAGLKGLGVSVCCEGLGSV